MEKAIKAGNLYNIKWIAHRNQEWKDDDGDQGCLILATKGGHLDCLEWLMHALGRT